MGGEPQTDRAAPAFVFHSWTKHNTSLKSVLHPDGMSSPDSFAANFKIKRYKRGRPTRVPVPGESQVGGRRSSEDGWHDGMDDRPGETSNIDLTGSDGDTSVRAGGSRTTARKQKSRRERGVDQDEEDAVDGESCFANVGVEGGGTGSSRYFRGTAHARQSSMERAPSPEKLGRKDNRGRRRHDRQNRQSRQRMLESDDPLDGPLAQQQSRHRGRDRDRDTSFTGKIGSKMDELDKRTKRQDHMSNKAGTAAEARRQNHGMNQNRKRSSSPRSERDSSSSSRKKRRSEVRVRRDEAINAEDGSEVIRSALHQAKQRVDDPDAMQKLMSKPGPGSSSSSESSHRTVF